MSSVIFINRFFYPDHSATSQLLSDVAFYLANENKDIKVITSRQLYNETETILASDENIRSVSVKRIWTTRFGRNHLTGRAIDYLSFYVSAFFVLLPMVKPDDFVIAKTDPPMISVIAKLVCIIKSAKLINWNQDLFPEVGTELGIKILEYTKPLLMYLRNKALKNAYMNVVLGETMKDKLLSLGVNHSNISIIPNWSNGAEIYPVAKENNILRKQWGIDKKFVVGYSGNMGRAHEFETILEIAEKLQSDEDIVFVFIGDGAKRQWIEDEVKSRGLNNFLFKAYQPRDTLASSLSVPDIHLISLFPNLEGLIVPSKYYGVAAAGRACLFIGDSNGEISRILKTNNCGEVIDIGDVQAGVNYILDMKNSQQKCFQQGNKARSVFLNKFDANIAFNKWKKILDAH
ncbi:MAG: glycosyltransferase family 4 protein [Candidatus Peribacteraceae bacterium]|nr:glycosyltransferase family 4 protein [Candidatus Peribacteraceae bacterium]